MLVGMALCIHLLVYAGLSLFIISGLSIYMVVCVVYAYNLTWGDLKNGKNGGEPNRFCLVFCHVVRKSHGHFRISTFKFELCREIFFEFHLVNSQSMSDRFSAHVRPVMHITLRHVFSNMCTRYNVINTICALI